MLIEKMMMGAIILGRTWRRRIESGPLLPNPIVDGFPLHGVDKNMYVFPNEKGHLIMIFLFNSGVI